MGLAAVSVIGLIAAYFMEDPIHINRIHENLKELKIKPLRKGEKCTYFMRIKDEKGRDKSYALTEDSFYFFVAHLSPNCEAFADYLLALWQQEPFKLILQPTLGETKQTETLGLWQFDGQRHTISLATGDIKKEVLALILLHEIAHLRLHTLTTKSIMYDLNGRKARSPYYGQQVKPHGAQFCQVFSEIARPTLEMKKLFSNRQKKHLKQYFESPQKAHLIPLNKCGSIPIY